MTQHSVTNPSSSLSETPGEELLNRTRAAFVLQGSSLSQFCKEAGINRTYAHNVLRHDHRGPKATKLRERILSAAGIAARKRPKGGSE